MTSPKITEGVMGVMKNPQNKAKNGCNECNDYITPITHRADRKRHYQHNFVFIPDSSQI